jgi:hypothetical protein
MSKKFKQKIRTCIFMCYVLTKSLHEQSTCCGSRVKRQNSVLKIKNFTIKNFSFLRRPQKLSVFHETSQTHIYCGYVHVEFFVKSFGHFKICFFGRGSICTREPNWFSTHSFPCCIILNTFFNIIYKNYSGFLPGVNLKKVVHYKSCLGQLFVPVGLVFSWHACFHGHD